MSHRSLDSGFLRHAKAIDSGHPDQAPKALRNLGLLHAEQGRVDEAITWYTKAADSGHVDVRQRAKQELENLD